MTDFNLLAAHLRESEAEREKTTYVQGMLPLLRMLSMKF